MIDWASDSGFSRRTTRRRSSSGGEAQPVEQGRVGEAPADDLIQAPPDHRVLGSPADPLGVAQHARCAAARREGRGQAIDAIDARDLLDQVDLARDVLAPQGRHGDLEAVRAPARWRSRAPSGSRAWRSTATGTPRIARTRDSRSAITVAGAGLPRPRRSCPSSTLRAAQLDHQARRHGLRVHALLGLQPLLEARRSLAAQAEAPRGAVDVRAAPGGDLQQHAPGVVLRPPSARRPSARRSTSGRRRPRSAPSRSRACASGRRASVSCSPSRARRTVRRAPATRSRSNACSGCAGEQHRVVGDVDDVVDRPLPGRHQPRLQPRRRRRDRDVLEHARGEARAELGALDASPATPSTAGPARAGILAPGRLRQRRAGGRVQLARDADTRPGSRAGWA